MVGKLRPDAEAAVEGCLSRMFPITRYAVSFQTTQSSGGPNDGVHYSPHRDGEVFKLEILDIRRPFCAFWSVGRGFRGCHGLRRFGG
jgi:hypothetical protein